MPDLPLLPDLFATPHRFLWHPATQTTILADLHLGLEATLATQGLTLPELPSTYLPALQRCWRHLLARNPRHIVIAGDLFDTPTPPPSAVDLARELLGEVPAGCRITLTPGNHDPAPDVLARLLTGIDIDIQPDCALAECIISHGHVLPNSEFSSQNSELKWILGHQHPAVVLATRVQSAKMACYAICTLSARSASNSKNQISKVILLPPFSRGPLGSNLRTTRNWLLPVPRPTDSHIRIAGIIEPGQGDAQVLDFGPLSLL